VLSYLKTIEEDGGEVVTGGVEHDWVVRPTVVIGSGPDARIVRDEVFGPIVPIIPFDSEQEAVTLVNATPFGLNAMVFTENLRRAHRVAALLHVGTVWTNCFFVRDLRAPFGGVGDSGVGREGGNFSREFFTEPKAVIMEI
jgi:aminomuconate-semialdehyde/2-hydroxymuconate-6-semialdehyde dehydrogenase